MADNSPKDSSERYNTPPRGIAWIEMCTNKFLKCQQLSVNLASNFKGLWGAISISKGYQCDSSLLLSNRLQWENIRDLTNRAISRAAAQSDYVQRLNVTLTCWSLSHFHAGGSDVLLNTVQVRHPRPHLYHQCSFKAGDLWLFSIYCHLQQFSASFLPQHQS